MTLVRCTETEIISSFLIVGQFQTKSNLFLQEEIAAVNLAKYRKVQAELEDAEERAESADTALQKIRMYNESYILTSPNSV
jgi:hypothetical protein